MLLLIPVVLTGLAVWLAWSRRARPAWVRVVLWGLVVLCLGYYSIPIWFIEEVDIGFIGVLFVPAALALMGFAIGYGMSGPKKGPAPER